MSWTPFCAKRIGPKGPDSPQHVFCVVAKGNPELIRTGESDAEVLINGAISSQPAKTREAIHKLVDALNGVWQDYLDGKFHEPSPVQASLDSMQATAEKRASEEV